MIAYSDSSVDQTSRLALSGTPEGTHHRYDHAGLVWWKCHREARPVEERGTFSTGLDETFITAAVMQE